MSTDRLVQFLQQRLDDDEQIALAATGRPWVLGRDHGYRFSQRGDVYAISSSGTPALVAHGHACGPDGTQEKTSNHLARHDPARVLADVQAKRAIVAQYVTDLHPPDFMSGLVVSVRQDRMHYVVCALANAFDTHADFDPAWSVSAAAVREHDV